MLSLTKLSLALLVGFLGWCYKSIQPPPPKICGSPNGPPITSPRIKLRDGRYLSYKESGVPKEEASYKIVVVHGFGDSKDFSFPASKGVVEGLGIYFVSFDRAGYGESDPNPSRSVKSEALDIEELADKLELGSRFYVICASMGCYSAWGCFKYIPHRLAGAALVVPVVNYWWPSFPSNLSKEAYGSLLVQDQWTLRMAHYAPSSLFYWWMTQKWFPSLAILDGHPESYSHQDREILQKMVKAKAEVPSEDKARQQGDFESLHRDLLVGFGTWDFDPVDIANPFPNSEGSVYLWQGYEDRFIPFKLQRFVSMRLPWIKYHEVPNGGHLFLYLEAMSDAILTELLLGGQASTVFG